MRLSISLLSLLITTISLVNAQSYNGFADDESTLYAMNKQVGQFVHRFNMEEDKFGKLLSRSDDRYRNNDLRKKILPAMFDEYNPRTSGNLKKYFVSDVANTCIAGTKRCNKRQPVNRFNPYQRRYKQSNYAHYDWPIRGVRQPGRSQKLLSAGI